MHGAKQWRLCSFTSATPFGVKTRIQQQCSTNVNLTPNFLVDASDMRTLSCRLEWLRPGDLLYMPAGTVHSATAGADGSAHATFGLGITWAMQAKRVALCPVAKTLERGKWLFPLVLGVFAVLALRRQPMILVGLVMAYTFDAYLR